MAVIIFCHTVTALLFNVLAALQWALKIKWWKGSLYMIIHIDFETRSEVELKHTGTWVYSRYPGTSILCMAYAVDEESVKLITTFEKCPFDVEDNVFVAHNASFEFYVWHNILVKQFNWPEIPLMQWRCTAAMAAAHALPRSLEGLAAALD